MLSRDRPPRNDRALPMFMTLLVLGILLMTFHVRLEGGGVVGVLRTGTQSIISPVQKAASYVVNPVADAIENLGDIAGLREENLALRATLEEKEAELIAVEDQLARLELLEDLYGLSTAGTDIGKTVANVIGRPDPFAADFVIDRGTSAGVAVGQPVVDTNGFVVGSVSSVTAISATVVPVTAARGGLTVLAGDQVGRLASQIGSAEMRLEIRDARAPVLAGDRIVTSSASVSFPAGLPVGEVTEDSTVQSTAVIASVMPYVDLDTLNLVVVLAWPADPVTAVGQDLAETTTTLGESATDEETTTSTEGDG